MSRHILVELGTDAAIVSVVADHLAPHGLQAGLDSGVLGHAATVLGLVDVHATLANVEAAVLFPLAALDLETDREDWFVVSGGCSRATSSRRTYLQDDLALVLVAESSLVSGEHSLGVQTSRSPLQRWRSHILGGSRGLGSGLCDLLAFNHCVCPGSREINKLIEVRFRVALENNYGNANRLSPCLGQDSVSTD